LRERCNEAGAFLVVDAIFTGLGRIGEMWPGSDVADILCVGKALGGGLPISAALFVKTDLERAWDFGEEDLYTHTHSGNPLACAAALVVLEEVPRLLPRISVLSERFASAGWHGEGLLRATPMNAAEAECAGVLVIPVPASEGQPELIQAAPPFTLSDDELDEAFGRLA
jgi:acetylornithine/succinyldiaminopimelate/putrescine aminotransferase